MSDVFNSRKIIKATRKDHKCLGCLKVISTGSKAVKNSGKYEGEFYSYYLHEECDQFLASVPNQFDEGLWDGCVNDIKREMEN